MASLEDLPLAMRLFMKAYPYRKAEWKVPALLKRPLPQSKLALVTTAALHLPDQTPFDEKRKGGDGSFREIPDDTPVQTLRIAHRSKAFDHAGLEADRNLALPLDRLHELRDAGKIGAVNHRHLSFAGGITAPGRLIRESAPQAAALFREDGVEAVLLVPV